MMSNGNMPATHLVEVEPGMFLEAATASAYLRAKAASGGILKIASPAGAYRSYAVQVDMKANPGKYGLDPASSVGVSAPGSSTHGFGTRVDIAVGAGRTWAIVHMGEFGFRREFGPADPGHFQFLSPTFAGTGVSPIPTQGEDMPKLIRHPGGAITTVGETTYQHHNWASYTADKAVYGEFTQLSETDYNQAVANTQIRLAYLKSQVGGGAGSSVDPAAIALKVEQSLADDFARLASQIAAVNANIDDQPTEFKVVPA